MPRVYHFDLVTKRVSTSQAVEPPPYVVTSKPYPIQLVDEISPGASISSGRLAVGLQTMPTEALDTAAAITAGELRTILRNYNLWPVEAVDPSASITAGELRVILRSYNLWPVEAVDTGANITDGSLKVVLVKYSFWPVEAVDVGASITSGSLA